MRIIVCVKQVLDPRGFTVNRKAEKIFVNREAYLLDPGSRAALQAAAAVKAAIAASNGSSPPEIVALSLGPARVDDVLREAIGFGADRAILLKDAAFDQADAFVVANALAAAVRKIGGCDLALLGAQSLDQASGELAPRLAEALDLPSFVAAAQIDVGQGAATLVCQSGDGYARTQSPLPLVASVLPEAFEPGFPDGWRLMDAYRQSTVEVWDAAELGLGEDDLRPASAKKEDAFPPERQLGVAIEDAQSLVTLLKRARVL